MTTQKTPVNQSHSKAAPRQAENTVVPLFIVCFRLEKEKQPARRSRRAGCLNSVVALRLARVFYQTQETPRFQA